MKFAETLASVTSFDEFKAQMEEVIARVIGHSFPLLQGEPISADSVMTQLMAEECLQEHQWKTAKKMNLARHKKKGYLGSVFAKSVDGFPIDWMRAEVNFLDKNID